VKIQLPTGGTLVAPTDPTHDPPSDCSQVFALLPLVASYLASMQGVLQIMDRRRSLVDVAGVRPFARDLLCLILRALNCILGQLKTQVAVLTTLASQLDAARAAGNADLVRTLETAQKNAQARTANVLPSIEAVQSLLDLAGPYFEIAGIGPVQLPSAPVHADLKTLIPLVESVASSAAALQIAVDGLGGCDA
jgi:hypothetical protein